jgi:hypothetical protein
LASRGTTSQIVRAPDALALVTAAVPEGVVNVPYAATVQASGGLLPYSFSATGLPPGMTMSNNGVLSGTPTTAGTNTLNVAVTDAQGQVQTRNYPLTRGTTLVIATTSLPDGLIGAPYSQTLAGLGGLEPYTWTLASGALPSGLSLDPASGQLTGTPATVGTSAFTVQVTDSAGRTASQAFTLTRTAPSFIRPDPTDELVSGDIESPVDSGCVLNQEQTQIVPAGEGPTGISFPNGLLQFELNGCTPGTQLTVNLAYPETLPATTQYWKYGPTPDNATAHWYVLPGAIIQGNTIRFTIQDGGYGDSDLTVNGSIRDPGGNGFADLVLTTNLPTTGQVGLAYSGTLTATNGVGPYVWSIADGSLPPGLTLATGNGASTTLSGTPTGAGSYSFTVQVIDIGTQNRVALAVVNNLQIGASVKSYIVSPEVKPTGSGSLTPGNAQTVPDGTRTAFMVQPNPGYVLVNVEGCGGALVSSTYTTGPVTADCSVTANFALIPVDKLAQSITFAALADQTVGVPPITLTATASSGLPVSYSSSGLCTLVDVSTLVVNAVGVCSVTANQAGDSVYEPAAPVTRSFTIASGALKPTSTSLVANPNPALAGEDVTLTAQVAAVGGVPTGTVRFRDSGNLLGVGTLVNGTASLTVNGFTVGEYSLTATYDGSGTYANSAGSLNLTVNAPPLVVTVPNLGGLTQSAASATIASAGLTQGTVTTAHSATIPAGLVMSQSPAAGTSAAPGSAVNLVISLGPFPVPNPIPTLSAWAQLFLIFSLMAMLWRGRQINSS